MQSKYWRHIFDFCYNSLVTSMPKNITNGLIDLNVEEEDRVDEDFKFIRAPNNDSLDFLRQENQKIANTYYIESTSAPTQTSEQASSLRYQKTIW